MTRIFINVRQTDMNSLFRVSHFWLPFHYISQKETKIMNTTIQLLLLNDLLNTGVIDRELYDKAAHKIAAEASDTSNRTPSLPACA